eukprot:1134652-Rhodomonas_salina.1
MGGEEEGEEEEEREGEGEGGREEASSGLTTITAAAPSAYAPQNQTQETAFQYKMYQECGFLDTRASTVCLLRPSAFISYLPSRIATSTSAARTAQRV